MIDCVQSIVSKLNHHANLIFRYFILILCYECNSLFSWIHWSFLNKLLLETSNFELAYETLIDLKLNGKSWKPHSSFNSIFLLKLHIFLKARSQDLNKRGGFFERVRQLLATLTRIFIVLGIRITRN